MQTVRFICTLASMGKVCALRFRWSPTNNTMWSASNLLAATTQAVHFNSILSHMILSCKSLKRLLRTCFTPCKREPATIFHTMATVCQNGCNDSSHPLIIHAPLQCNAPAPSTRSGFYLSIPWIRAWPCDFLSQWDICKPNTCRVLKRTCALVLFLFWLPWGEYAC